MALGAALVAACGGLFETALRLDAPPQRFADADVVVAAGEHAQVNEHAVALTGRSRAAAARGRCSRRRRARSGRAPRAHADPFALRCESRSPRASRHGARRAAAWALTGDDRGRGEAVGVAAARLKLILIASIFGGMALIVMAILVASIISLAVEQRHREFALLRTIGATPRQVRRLVVRQTVRPALLAALAARSPDRRWRARCSAASRTAAWCRRCSRCARACSRWWRACWPALLVVRVAAGLAARRAGKVTLVEALGEVEAPGTVGRVRLGLAAVRLAGALVVRGRHAVHAARQRGRDGRRDGARGRARLCAARSAAGRAPRRAAFGRRGAARRPPGHAGDPEPARAGAPHRALVIPVLLVAAIALANVYQLTTQSNAMRSAFSGSCTTARTACAARAGSSSPSIRRTRSTRGRCSAADPSALAVEAPRARWTTCTATRWRSRESAGHRVASATASGWCSATARACA